MTTCNLPRVYRYHSNWIREMRKALNLNYRHFHRSCPLLSGSIFPHLGPRDRLCQFSSQQSALPQHHQKKGQKPTELEAEKRAKKKKRTKQLFLISQCFAPKGKMPAGPKRGRMTIAYNEQGVACLLRPPSSDPKGIPGTDRHLVREDPNRCPRYPHVKGL